MEWYFFSQLPYVVLTPDSSFAYTAFLWNLPEGITLAPHQHGLHDLMGGAKPELIGVPGTEIGSCQEAITAFQRL